MTEWVQPEDEAVRNLAITALACRGTGRHNFGNLLSHLRRGDKVAAVKLGQIDLEVACEGNCGVVLHVAYSLRGQLVSRHVDYSGAKDNNGNSTYLMPKGSGRLHPEDARGELFERLGYGGAAKKPKAGKNHLRAVA